MFKNKPNMNLALIELYILIGGQNNFDIDKMMDIIFRPDFKLLINDKNQEEKLSEQEFQNYHDHCFETPLLAICHIASQHNMEITDQQLAKIIKHLVHLHADVDAVDEDGNSALLLLASSVPHRAHLIESIQLLIMEGADINSLNNEGKNVLHRSFEMMNFSLASHLYYDLGAKVVWDKYNSTFLLECHEHALEDLKKQTSELIQNLVMHHLITRNISEHNDSLYQALIKDPSGKEAISLCKTKNIPITEKAFSYALEQGEDKVVSALFNCLERKLKAIYSSREFLLEQGFHKIGSNDGDKSEDLTWGTTAQYGI